ncbi:MAG: tRNA uridine-5-carboxymethylaminomethyl(34) synthesis GTPase MnmE [Dehalococcoidia bacterium]
MYQDTIAAIATPLGESGIGIVRLSGPDAQGIARRLFTGRLSHRHLGYGHIIDPETGEQVDEVLATYMAAPHTYTRQDMVEINCHGGPAPLQRILGLVLRYGARLANPGEFTLRAFLNGRIDLAQAEAVADIVRARTAASLRLAVEGLGGRLSRRVREVRGELMSALAYLTARIDFPEDEVEEQDVRGPLTKAHQTLQELAQGADAGIAYRQGIRTAIVGRPNVGKSSLLNCLLDRDRAIVSPVPGTTRDTVEEVVNLRGIPFVLADTAGLRQSRDPVESLGVERSRRALEQADLVLLIIDSSEPLTEEDRAIMGLIGDRAAVVAANKCDLAGRAEIGGFPWPVLPTSALTGQGLAELEEAMARLALGGRVVASDALLVTNPRHKEALERALGHLAQALEGLGGELADDFITIDLRAALDALGEITGETVSEELLETIFSQFCIGK